MLVKERLRPLILKGSYTIWVEVAAAPAPGMQCETTRVARIWFCAFGL